MKQLRKLKMVAYNLTAAQQFDFTCFDFNRSEALSLNSFIRVHLYTFETDKV